MANFFEGLGNILLHPIHEAKFLWKEGIEDVGKNLIRGDFSQAWDEVKQIPGAHNRMMADNITIPLFGHNKLSENPDAVAGAVVGSIFAAPLIASAGSSIFSGSGAGVTAGEGAAAGTDWGKLARAGGRALNSMSQQQQQAPQPTQVQQTNTSFSPTPIDPSLGQMQWQNDGLLDLDTILGQLQGGVGGV